MEQLNSEQSLATLNSLPVTDAPKYFRIVLAEKLDMCLEAANGIGHYLNGCTFQLNKWNGTDNQIWVYTHDFTLQNKSNGLVLDVPAGNPLKDIVLWKANGGPNQKWHMSGDGSGGLIFSDDPPGYFLTTQGYKETARLRVMNSELPGQRFFTVLV